MNEGGLRQDIESALVDVRQRIVRACERVGRNPRDVRLVAVSKTRPVADIKPAYEQGQRCFGENYVQDLVRKAQELSGLADIEWHLIGHLQRNKVKDVVTAATWIETVDSSRLAEAIAKQANAVNRRMSVLIQVKFDSTTHRAGCEVRDLPKLVDLVRSLESLSLQGLMTVPPPGPEHARSCFRELRGLAAQFGLPELSMGMSDDFETAVEEGATIVRVGTAIFGARN